jgi:hypothetical protein
VRSFPEECGAGHTGEIVADAGAEVADRGVCVALFAEHEGGAGEDDVDVVSEGAAGCPVEPPPSLEPWGCH